MGRYTLAVEEHPGEEDVQLVEEKLHEFNMVTTGYYSYPQLAIFVRDEEGRIVAGLTGGVWGGCCEIRYLWVHEALRGMGYGTKLMQAAEREAIEAGCAAIVLSSHSFQAPGFYQKLGYEVVGVAEGYPHGYAQVYLRKSLVADGS